MGAPPRSSPAFDYAGNLYQLEDNLRSGYWKQAGFQSPQEYIDVFNQAATSRGLMPYGGMQQTQKPAGPSPEQIAADATKKKNDQILSRNQGLAQQMIGQFGQMPQNAGRTAQFQGNPFLRQANAVMGQPSAPMQQPGLGGSRAPALPLQPQQGMAKGGIPKLQRGHGFYPVGLKGLLRSSVAGRTDHIPAKVKEGSFVIPADIVSGLGEGNTEAGAKKLKGIFSGLPAGTSIPNMSSGMPMTFARGGKTKKDIPIMAAGGEFILTPEEVAQIGGGDEKKGHAILVEFVKQARSKIVKDMNKLPVPRK